MRLLDSEPERNSNDVDLLAFEIPVVLCIVPEDARGAYLGEWCSPRIQNTPSHPGFREQLQTDSHLEAS
jgi:hypothetical protein